MAGRTKVQFTQDYSYEFVAPATTLETRLEKDGSTVSVIEIPEKRHTITYTKGQILKLSNKEANDFVSRLPGVCTIL